MKLTKRVLPYYPLLRALRCRPSALRSWPFGRLLASAWLRGSPPFSTPFHLVQHPGILHPPSCVPKRGLCDYILLLISLWHFFAQKCAIWHDSLMGQEDALASRHNFERAGICFLPEPNQKVGARFSLLLPVLLHLLAVCAAPAQPSMLDLLRKDLCRPVQGMPATPPAPVSITKTFSPGWRYTAPLGRKRKNLRRGTAGISVAGNSVWQTTSSRFKQGLARMDGVGFNAGK